MQGIKRLGPLAMISALALLAPGCATKKYVSKVISPLEVHLNKVDKNGQQNTQDIKDVDARAERGISDAQHSADQAGQAAQTADQDAKSADQHAQTAQSTAQQGLTQAQTAQQIAENVDNYQANQKAVVLFAFNSDALTKQDKENLDQFAQAVQSQKHYVIQVQGYTDTIGPKAYNVQLSQRRADAVVRYITTKYSIPLVRVYLLGYGEANPAASNHTRKGRIQNRRVDLTLMVPPTATVAQQQTPSGSTASPLNQK